jgi:hypothetical protein
MEAAVHYKLRSDQERNRHEEAYVDLQVPQEWHRDTMTDQITVQSGEQEKRQPTNQRNDNHALPQMRHRIVGEVGLTKKLK